MKFAGVCIRARESKAVIFDENKSKIFENSAEGVNYHRAKSEGVVTLLRKLLDNIESIDCLCVGVAGCDRTKDIYDLTEELMKLVRDCIVYNIGVIALVGASGKTLGGENAVMIEADTGSIAFGVNKNAEVKRAGGWGYLLGDEGSAFDIGRKALIHATKAYDGVEKNKLVEGIMSFLSLKEFGDVLDLYDAQNPIDYVAGLFPLVCKLAENDRTAKKILEDSIESLAKVVRTLPKRLEMKGEIVLYETGMAFEEPQYKTIFDNSVAEFLIRKPKHSPELGAAMLAFEKLTGNFEELE